MILEIIKARLLQVFICVYGLAFLSCESDIVKKPNVLILYMDDLRPQLGCYGNELIQSPNIDELASSSVLFNNAYCNVPVCGASRASMLTGMYPTKDRYINFNTFVKEESPNAITLPMLFKQNGYQTISNGKVYHHIDDNQNDWTEIWRPYAFDKNNLGLAPTDYWQGLWKDYQNEANAKIYKETDLGPAFESAPINDSVYIDGIMTQKVIKDIKKFKKTGEPFFLTAGFISNHLPFNAPTSHWDKYDKNDIKQPNNNYIPKNALPMSLSNWGEMRAYTNIPKKGQVTDETALKLIHGYNATVSYADVLIGKILKTLESEGLAENTIVVLVADHGYSLQEHTLWAKFNPYKDASQVPLIIKTPHSKKGKVTNALVELVDLYPTIAELCNLETPKNQLDGKSLVSILDNPKIKGKEYIFTKTANAFTITSNRYSYTEFINLNKQETIASMLFDHQTDPKENENIVSNEEYNTVVAEFKEILHTKFKSNILGKKNDYKHKKHDK